MKGFFKMFQRQAIVPAIKEPPFQLQAIGKGPIGPKAQCLVNDRERIIKAGIQFPQFVPITSEIFKEVAVESGASKAKNEIDAIQCLNQYKLSPALFSQISEHAISFDTQDNNGRAVMVRNDDYALGLGLTYSGPAAITGEQDEKLFVSRVLQQLRRSWASCFSENFRIFAQMKSLADIGATMLMPVYGMAVIDEKDGSNGLLYTPISINFLGYSGSSSNKTAIFSVGAGIGGANKPGFSKRFRGYGISEKSVHDAMVIALNDRAKSSHSGPRVLDMERSEMASLWQMLDKEVAIYDVNSFLRDLEKNTSALHLQLSNFSSNAQRYAEFVMPEYSPQLTCVQTSPVILEPATMPQVSGRSVILESDSVVGSTSISTRNVRFASKAPTEDDVRFNRENNGYLLVIDVGGSSGNIKWELKHLYNAGAVVICVDQSKASWFEFSTHLDGYFRELGIPVLGADAESAAAFRRKIGPASHCLVAADEFPADSRPRGFVALI
ncbi:MAG: hypothetical protein WC861_02005 [Candidatus Micrarchaeia archaeon]|jgi:hypothetical protein